MDVEAWLRRLGLVQYAAAFAEHDIDSETLVKLTGDDLKEIGVASIGHRRKLLDAAAHLGEAAAASTPLDEATWSVPQAERRQLTVMFVELVGGALLAIGLFTRPVAFILSGTMAVAYFYAHFPQGFYPLLNGGELAALYCFVFLFIAAAGGGAWSIDRFRTRGK